jgi:hypothetical protein
VTTTPTPWLVPPCDLCQPYYPNDTAPSVRWQSNACNACIRLSLYECIACHGTTGLPSNLLPSDAH